VATTGACAAPPPRNSCSGFSVVVKRRGGALAAFAFLLALAAALAPAADARFMALSYHEVLADHEPLTPTAVRASDLARQFAWLRANDFHPVSVEQILAARAGGRPLPAKSILLTFDDGFKDAYTRVFPLLKLFDYPAVIALVGQWMDVPEGQIVDYDGKPVPRGKFLTWEQVREMQASGLVEVASHSYGLHRGILANPQGNTQPAATTRLYANGVTRTMPLTAPACVTNSVTASAGTPARRRASSSGPTAAATRPRRRSPPSSACRSARCAS